jgi:prepilin-type N-terminal cleavage/methylation domain-containing protein
MAGKRPALAGMTLIELLIAVAIGAIVLAALNSVVSLGLQAQTSGRQGNELVYQTRFALERMITTARSVSPKSLTTPNASTTCGGVGAPVAVAGGSTVTLPAGRSIPANGSCTLTVNVTAAAGGSYINTLPANALVTNNGNNGNNARQAVATLTVISPGTTLPTLGKAFSPATINADGFSTSTLTLTLSNPYGAVATLTNSLVDTLPSGVVIAAAPNVSTTCGGVGAPVAVAGTSTVTLPAGRSIPAYGSCTLTVTVNVTVDSQGIAPSGLVNTLATGALKTSNGNNAAQAVATLTTIPSFADAPRLGKDFSPASINAGGVSTLTVTLSNPHNSVVTLTAPLIDTLPSGVMIAAMPSGVVTAATPAAGTTGNWFSPVMYCLNGSSQLIETTTADNGCIGTTMIARNVSAFSAQLPSGVGPVDEPAATLILTLVNSAAPQTVTLSTSVRLGGGTF